MLNKKVGPKYFGLLKTQVVKYEMKVKVIKYFLQIFVI